MQLWLIGKTTKINLNDRFNNIHLNPDLEGIAGLPELRTSQGVNIGTDGGWTGDQNYNPRFIALTGVIASQDVTKVEERRRQLTALLSEKKLLLKYVSDGGNTYTTNVVVLGFISNIGALVTAAKYKINLKADDPLWYDYGDGAGVVATLKIEQAKNGFEINFELPLEIAGSESTSTINNTGNSRVDPIFTIFGPMHSPKIISATTNQTLQILTDLTADDIVIVNSRLRTIVQTDRASYNAAIAAGTEPTGTDIYYLRAEGSQFIDLEPGENTLNLSSAQNGDTGYAEVKYSSGYIGI